jgi:hypothetical protein
MVLWEVGFIVPLELYAAWRGRARQVVVRICRKEFYAGAVVIAPSGGFGAVVSQRHAPGLTV